MSESCSLVRTFDLPGGGLIPFASSPGERVRILQGRVWLTEEGVRRDAFLASGEEVSLDSRGLAVIEAFGPARIQVLEEVRGPAWLFRALAAFAQAVAALVRHARPARLRSCDLA